MLVRTQNWVSKTDLTRYLRVRTRSISLIAGSLPSFRTGGRRDGPERRSDRVDTPRARAFLSRSRTAAARICSAHVRRHPDPGRRRGRRPDGRGRAAPARLRRAAEARRRPAGRREAGPDPPADRPGPRGVPPAGRRRTRRRTGTAAGTSSPPPPRPCAASSSNRPAGKAPSEARRRRDRRCAWTRRPGRRRPRRTTTCSPSTRRSTGSPADDPQAAQLVKLRYFAGLSVDEAADALGIVRSTADDHWAYARAWLRSAARLRCDCRPDESISLPDSPEPDSRTDGEDSTEVPMTTSLERARDVSSTLAGNVPRRTHWAASTWRSCGGDAEPAADGWPIARRPTGDAGSFLERACRRPRLARSTSRPPKAPGTVDRPVQAAGADRRGRDRRRSSWPSRPSRSAARWR